MNKNILILDQNEMEPSTPVGDRENYHVRRAARAVLFDMSGRVALIYAGQRDYYKLPGGGIEDGEEIEEALVRELMEETGSTTDVTQSLGTVIEWRDYSKMKQISYAFIATLSGESGYPNFTQSELDEGFEMKWVANLDEAVRLVESKVTHDDINVVFMTKRDSAILRAAK